MTTIREIASSAGVSLGTVSNYLNDPTLVAEETRARIERIVKELDYHPKAAARSLKSHLTHRIGLVPIISPEDNRSADPGDNAFLELLAGLNTVAAENGFDILISAATNGAQELKTYERVVGEAQIDGLVIMGIHAQDERLKFLKAKKFPFVAYGRSDLTMQYPYVDVDGASGIAEAIDYLAKIGHRRIAYITPAPSLMCTSQRWEGFVRGMGQNQLPIRDEYILQGDFGEFSGINGAEQLMGLTEPPTAILTSNDVCAFGVIRTLQVHNVLVGKQVSVIGFDDISLADHWQPSLTTISQPFRKIGFTLMQSMLSILSGENPNPQTVLESRLVVRESSGRNTL
jgi:LacI family transcriptional regulator/LacI family repressor for deo operon, udp, cdd, tsx, nupC, and nupG